MRRVRHRQLQCRQHPAVHIKDVLSTAFEVRARRFAVAGQRTAIAAAGGSGERGEAVQAMPERIQRKGAQLTHLLITATNT